MEKTLVGKVTDLEKENIENLYERMNSLHSLSLTLAANNDLFLEKSYMADKIISDLAHTQTEFNKWWDFIADKYNLDRTVMPSYHVDFSDGSLYCLKENVV